LVGLNAAAISKNLSVSHPMLAGALAGGKYPSLSVGFDVVSGTPVPAFAAWEMFAASAIYWYIVPIIQFAVAIIFVDTWQYFLHRAMHMNKWLYTTFHSRHHRLYVPYAYGALYNHPFEGFLLDTLGAGLAYKVAGLTVRQGMCFFVGSTFKTVDDHCGYALPWDPLQHLTGNNAGYHDIHHQSWGIKTNFSQPFFTFWDRILGTIWTGDTTAKYERSKKSAQFKMDAEKVQL
jgi:sphinganine C4-monooxygenase